MAFKNFQLNRPKGYRGEADKYLPETVKDLSQVLKKAQKSFIYIDLYLLSRRIAELAGILVEFAEDIHNNIGIWKSYEQYNCELFDTPLPITLEPGMKVEERELFKYRLRHLLWVLYSVIEPGLIFEPDHKDLILLTESAADFLEERFSRIPRGSGIKAFLSQPNEYGWDVKRKLIWLGQHSYLFRNSFQNYIFEEYDGEKNIAIIDDFICQENTCWSGLGVIDILAAALDITEKQRSQLRSWYERHLAYYRVLAVREPIIEVLNLINDKPYTVMVGTDGGPFEAQQIIFGSLVPWDDKWYWSGEQAISPPLPEKSIQKLKENVFRKLFKAAYRYCDERAQKARDMVHTYYRRFVEYNGDDLIIYPDGVSMAADWKRQYPLVYGPETPSKRLKKPSVSVPAPIEKSKNGVGVYFNSEEGEEIMLEFNDVVTGFKKKGINLNEYEEESIIDFIRNDSTSPAFVKKLVEKYGDESIEAVFLIDGLKHKYYLDYLLRRYKGHFYRNRYPSVSFI